MQYPLLPEIPIAVSRDVFLTSFSFSFSSLHCKDSAVNKSPAKSLTQQKENTFQKLLCWKNPVMKHEDTQKQAQDQELLP